ncbi:MAG: DUF6206 family protein [Candidatus Marinimicrobia bacterium]|nr:DUF6206 family protein [Candidatus Neomarinimicrobiota bacterium]MCF7850337.1 DUF6206 family protein [Candidatus Neomarinimicrobiota bacterium]
MELTQERIQAFETGLDPADPLASEIPCKVLGYGEISTVLQIDNNAEYAAKRMPLFRSEADALAYIKNYNNYCNRLREAGLTIPPDDTILVQGHAGGTVLYIMQKQLPPHRFCHKLIHSENAVTMTRVGTSIISAIEKVWSYNDKQHPEVRLAIDGQLSNWVFLESGELLFIDTSTPLMHENGKEVLDPELLLQSAPSFLRWLIRWLFLEGVMNRYYDRRLVYTDLIANLFKEQRPDLVEEWIQQINADLGTKMEPLDRLEIKKYYTEDKRIWVLFLALRRLDRFIKVKLLGQRYDFVLPGRIDR